MSKKTVQLIIEGGNDYVIAVKGNQKRLHEQIKLTTEQTPPISFDITTERRSDRMTTRSVSVFDDLSGISYDWAGLQRLIKVERFGTRAGKPYHQIVYYISSLTINAAQFAQGIRGHWGIENRLHWVKDVVLDEDNSRMRQGNAPANFSIIRSLVLTILRYNGYSSITTGIRLISHDLEQIFQLIGYVPTRVFEPNPKTFVVTCASASANGKSDRVFEPNPKTFMVTSSSASANGKSDRVFEPNPRTFVVTCSSASANGKSDRVK